MRSAGFFGYTVLMIIYTIPLLAQHTGTGTLIKGTVAGKNSAASNVGVLLQASKDSLLVKGTITDSSGDFYFSNIQPGSYFVNLQSIGYENYTTAAFTVNDSTGTYTLLPVMLHEAAASTLGAVTVTGKKPVIERKIGMLVFNVENSISAAGSTAWDMLKQAPSVKTDEQGNVSMRANNSASIMINNKLVNLSGDDLKNLLMNIRSEDISKIELMTNPSARYDAEGSGGLINIITKKNKEEGWNGYATAGYEQTTYAKYMAGSNLHYKHHNLTVSGNYGYKNGKYLTREYLEQQYDKGNSPTFYNETLNRHRNQVNHTYKLDVSYALSKKSAVGIVIDGNHTDRNNKDESNTPISVPNAKIDSTYFSRIFINGLNNYLDLNTNYRGLFDTLGRSLNIDIDYLRYNSNNDSYNINHFLAAGGQDMRLPYVFRSSVPQAIRIYTAKIDYAHPFDANTSLELGAKANKTETDNNYAFENFINNVYIPDSTRSNHFDYRETVLASYVNFTKAIHTLTLQAGLRAEYTSTKGHSLTLKSQIDRSYFRVFPTLYIQQTFSDTYQVELNYGKRIKRPSYAYLNPFRYYSTPYSYTEGNPFLQPAYTHSIELVNTWKSKYIVTLYYYSTTGEFVQIPEQNTDTKTIAFHRLNLDKSMSVGVSIELPFEVGRWQSYNSIDVSHDQVSSAYLGSNFSYKKMTANINSVQSFELGRKWSAELRGNYRFPSVSGLFHLGTYSEVDFGIKRKLANDRVTASLNFSDMFRGTIMPASVNYLDQKSTAKTDNDIRGVRINLSYKLGKSKFKPLKEHATGNKEEQNRVLK